MGFPGVSIAVQNANLQRNITVLDAVPALLCTAKTGGVIGAVKQVYSLPDAVSKGITETAEPYLYSVLNEYYTELGGNQLLYVLGFADTDSMTEMLDKDSTTAVMKVMQASNNAVNLIAVTRVPDAGYDDGAAFLDADVVTAENAAKVLAQYQQAKNAPLRVLIDGRVANKDAANTFTPNTQGNGYAGVVLGGSTTSGNASVALALARAVKYGAHVKLGNGQNGALTAEQIYIGADKIEDRTDMATLHDAGFITFHSRPGVSGYFFGKDNMCSDDDFSTLVHGRVIDKAHRLAAIAGTPYVESDVRVKNDGTINDADAAELEGVIEQAIRAKMNEQISDVQVLVDTTTNVVNTSTTNINVSVLPLGYLTYIKITLGLTSSVSA